MKLAKENLGKVSVTIEKAYHSVDKEYDKLVVVEEEGQFRTFISRKPVPIGIELTDREFWLPFSSVKESIVIDYNKFKQYIRTGEGLLDDSIVTRHIKDRNVTGDKIAEATITFVNIANEAVTLPKINKEAIDTTLTKEGHLAEAKHTGDRLLNVEGLAVVKVPSTQSTVLDAWQIIDKKGNVHGVTINTYKDKSIDAIWLSVHEDDPKPENPEVKVDNPRYLNIIYNKADGTQQKVSIPLASFVTEAEFSKNGFKVINGVVNLKISSDITTSRYFHFDADGNITLDGFEERILEDLGTLEHSQSGDGTMWGEFKEQEEIREQVSNSAHQVFSDNWDEQDDDPEDYDPLAVTEASFAYNWKSVTNPNKTGNIEDLVNKVDALAVGIFYGYHPNENELPQDITEKGYAYVGTDNPYKIYNFDGTQWKDSSTTIQATSEADEEDITYNENDKLTFKDRNNTDGMGYVILRKNKSFVEQVTKENTIYEIRYDFNLGGAEISIPEDSILKFEGGVLRNGTINFQETILSGEPHIITDFRGSIKNKEINISWFGVSSNNPNFDNAPIISKVINTFKRGTLHSNTYYIKSPIIFDNIVDSPGHINLDCNIIYNGIGGTSENYLECIIFENFYGGNLYIKELVNKSNYCTGIRFCKGKRNTITVNEIIGFNYGVVCSPKTNEGFSENYFYIKEIQSHGICTHLVLDGSVGWVNANVFYNTYLGIDKRENNNVTGILLKSGASYRPSTNVFNNFSFEWNDKCIILDNAINNYFIDTRTENCSNIITAKGESYDNFVSLTYYSNSSYPFISFVDMSEQQDGWLWGTLVKITNRNVLDQISADVSFVDKYKRCTPIQENGYFTGIIEDFVFSSGYHTPGVYIGNNIVNYARMKIDSGIILGYNDFVGRLIDTSNCKELYFTANISSSEFSCFFVYIEENGVELLTNKDKEPPRVGRNVTWDDKYDMFNIGVLNSNTIYKLVLPESITKACLLIRGKHIDTDSLKGLSIMGNNSSVSFITLNSKIDTPKENIIYPYIGQINISSGQPIWWTGTKWVDATGTDV